MKNEIKKLTFTKDDANLFKIDDLKLKADAVRYDVLPRLNILINHAISKIYEIYKIDVFEDSHIAQSPNFRLKRENPLKLDYSWANVNLTGKRVDQWCGISRKNGDFVKIIPLRLGFNLSVKGINIFFSNSGIKLNQESFDKILKFLADKNEYITAFSILSGIYPFIDHIVNDKENMVTIKKHFLNQIDRQNFFFYYLSKTKKFPINENDLESFVYSFAYFFPVYDSIIRICKGQKPQLKILMERLNKWIKKDISNLSEKGKKKNKKIKITNEQSIKLKKFAEKKIKIMPSIRWQVFQRDGWKCVACGRNSKKGIILQVDHIIPRSKGGKNTLNNYQTLCWECNIGKSNKDNTDLR